MSIHKITGLILAGGRGSRMGGVDKGLQLFNGIPLALNALQRLQQQTLPLSAVMLNANRHLDEYRRFGVQAWPDAPVSFAGPHASQASPLEFAGPLAGFLAGLAHCDTPYLLTVPCDVPRFPLDLAARLMQALQTNHAEIAMASGREEDGKLRTQPVFCLMQVTLKPSLERFIQAGGRKIDAWTARHHTLEVPFDLPSDDALAFANANTLEELRALEARR